MLTHLPPTTDLIKRNSCFSEKGIIEAWGAISAFLEEHDKWEDCESLHEAALSLHLSSLGDRHTTTAFSKLRLDEFRVRREESEEHGASTSGRQILSVSQTDGEKRNNRGLRFGAFASEANNTEANTNKRSGNYAGSGRAKGLYFRVT